MWDPGGGRGWEGCQVDTAPAVLGEACHLLGTQRSLQPDLPTPHNRISGDSGCHGTPRVQGTAKGEGQGCSIRAPLCGTWPPFCKALGPTWALCPCPPSAMATAQLDRCFSRLLPPHLAPDGPGGGCDLPWWPSSPQNRPPSGRLMDGEPCWSRHLTCKGC